jgi:tetratricopeptide (TPR) repeat protein
LATGEIKPQGAGYVIELSVLDCSSRRTLYHMQGESKDKDEVMTTVRQVAAATRLQLSGNPGNLSASPAPLPTKSLPAFKDYLLGIRDVQAWGWLAIADRNLGESQREIEDLTREFALRENLPDSEKAFAEARYYLGVTGEIYKGLGESVAAQKNCSQATKFANSKSVKVAMARVVALNGQSREAQQMITSLTRDHPSATLLNGVDAPVIFAASQLKKGQADQALRTLEAAKSYEFGGHAGLLPNYLRALAFLQLGRSNEAATEFNAVLVHRSVAPLDPLWSLSRLGLAQAHKMQGDTTKARAAYQDFLTLWEDADAGIPILQQAKSEYATLKSDLIR